MSRTAFSLTEESREQAARWCVRLSEGPLDRVEHAQFQAWLESDPEHPALFERTVIAWSALEDQAGQPEMIMMRGEALESVRRANRRRWTSASMGWHQLAAIAACLLLLIGGAAWWRFMPTSYETGAGERRVVALADGSQISLDASTRVDVRYLGDRRQLWLERGRAKFSVAKDPLRPFSVEAGERLVIATGTQFSVEKLTGQVRVLLYEGRVAVMDMSHSAHKPKPLRLGGRTAEQVLAPGLELIVGDEAPRALLEPVDLSRTAGWETGLLEFNEEPLGVAVERMNRYGKSKLRVDNADDGQIPISGQFVGGEVDAFVEGVTAVFPVEAIHGADGTVLLRSTGG